MEELYIVTGATGHLGGTIVRLLRAQGAEVRGLLLPGEQPPQGGGVAYYPGDVRDVASLEPLFSGVGARRVTVLHTAGVVDISADQVTEAMEQVNVQGTEHILALCKKYQVARLVHVSSVHAIPEGDPLGVIAEAEDFSAQAVVGGYAKTKAAATRAVLAAAAEGLDAVVVHPSGILGPYAARGNHLVQMIADYLAGRLPACVRGGYDFVDVRDVAQGCLDAARLGRRGQCYILSGRHYMVHQVLSMVRREGGVRRLPVLPLWLARAAAPLLEWWARRRGRRPLYTRYSLYTLSSNDRFSHDKATAELGYRPRDLRETVHDTVLWLRSHDEQLRAKAARQVKTRKKHRGSMKGLPAAG